MTKDTRREEYTLYVIFKNQTSEILESTVWRREARGGCPDAFFLKGPLAGAEATTAGWDVGSWGCWKFYEEVTGYW